MNKQSRILIVGGGVFGTSTAYHLAQRGYTSVTVADRFEPPSRDSAATDLNKVVRADYTNPLYSKLALEAMEVWKDPESIFAGMYRESGWVMAASSVAHGWLESARKTAEKVGLKGVGYLTAEQLKKRWPAFTGDFPGWTNLYSPAAGWVSRHSSMDRRMHC